MKAPEILKISNTIDNLTTQLNMQLLAVFNI